MPEADPAVQRQLLAVADTDKAIAAAEHRRTSLAELAVIESATAQLVGLRVAKVNAETEVADLDRDAAKLDSEIDQVRARADRDARRLADGSGPAKDLTNLQHELEALARRQNDLEEQALELMERREIADAALSAARTAFDDTEAELAGATTRRDDAYADIADELARLGAARAAQVAQIPADVLAVYERVHASGRIGAAELAGSVCSACRLSLDASALNEIRAAAPESIVRCTECGAILVRQ